MEITFWQGIEWNSLQCTLADEIKLECHNSTIYHYVSVVDFAKTRFSNGCWPLFCTCRRHYLPTRGISSHESWDQELTTWWQLLPSTQTVWESLCLQSKGPVSKQLWKYICQNITFHSPTILFHHLQGLCQGSQVYAWSKQVSSLCLWPGISLLLLFRATDLTMDQEVGQTNFSVSC